MKSEPAADMGELLELLACPACGGPLVSEPGRLRCSHCDRAFRLDGAVPVLLRGESENHPPSALARLHYAILGNPRVFDIQQALTGGRRVAARVGAELGNFRGSTLLDIGAGTGVVAGLVPSATRYIWFDNDERKLSGFLSKRLDRHAVLGDAQHLPFRDRAVDWSVMVEVSHHLPDDVLQAALREAARVTRDRFVLVDLLRGTTLRGRVLWQFDLGSFARTQAELISALEAHFELERVEVFRVNHDHLICVCIPKQAAP